VNLQVSESHYQVSQYLANRQWDQAIALCEACITHDPLAKWAYWYLGLTYLLQGQEAEANFTWAIAMAEGEPPEVQAWTEELWQVLHREAIQQETQNILQEAWIIRQGMRSLIPLDLENLLHLIRLSLQQGNLTVEELIDLDLMTALRSQAPAEVNAPLLLEVLQQLLEHLFAESMVVELIEAA